MSCKHIISSLLYSQRQQGNPDVKVTWDDTENSYYKRGRWWVTDYRRRIRYVIYRDGDGKLICPCGRKPDCEHRKAIRDYLNNNGGGDGDGNGRKRIVNDSGSVKAKAIQDKLNGNNGTGKVNPSLSTSNIDPSAQIYIESDNLDAEQILTGEGSRVHKLSNNDYVISYNGIMALADKYGIVTETLEDNPKQGYVTVKAFRPDTKNVRKSVQPVNGSFDVAEGKAKRNSIRMLLPLEHIKAVEYKAKLEADFDWQVAYAKCIELVGTKAILDCIIYDLVNWGKLRQDNPSHYDRTEWLIIHDACKKAADDNNDGDGDNPSSNNWQSKLRECKDVAINWTRYDYLRSDLEREGIISGNPKDWNDNDFDILKRAGELDTSLHNRVIGDFVVIKEWNWNNYNYSRRYRFWIVMNDTGELREKCFNCGKTKSQVSQLSDELIYWERYYLKTVVCNNCRESTTREMLTKKFDELYQRSPNAVNTDGLPKPSEDFIHQIDNVFKRGGKATPSERTPELPLTEDDFVRRCRESFLSVDLDEFVEANEMPLESAATDGQRRLQMDKKLKTWLIEADGTKKPISCREICETFESKQNPSIVTRLRAGIDDGADISIVELDN